jgi:hypothetical protein
VVWNKVNYSQLLDISRMKWQSIAQRSIICLMGLGIRLQSQLAQSMPAVANPAIVCQDETTSPSG